MKNLLWKMSRPVLNLFLMGSLLMPSVTPLAGAQNTALPFSHFSPQTLALRACTSNELGQNAALLMYEKSLFVRTPKTSATPTDLTPPKTGLRVALEKTIAWFSQHKKIFVLIPALYATLLALEERAKPHLQLVPVHFSKELASASFDEKLVMESVDRHLRQIHYDAQVQMPERLWGKEAVLPAITIPGVDKDLTEKVLEVVRLGSEIERISGSVQLTGTAKTEKKKRELLIRLRHFQPGEGEQDLPLITAPLESMNDDELGRLIAKAIVEHRSPEVAAGQLYFFHKKTAEAIAIVERHQKTDEQVLSAGLLHATILYETGKDKAGQALLDKLQRSFPRSGRFWHVSGKLDKKNELAHYAKSELQGASDALYVDWAQVIVAENPEEAFRKYGQALDLNPKNPEAHFGRGVILESWKKYDEALRAYYQTLRLDPSDANAYYRVARVLWIQKELHQATSAINRAIELQPNNAYFYYTLAMMLSDMPTPEDMDFVFDTDEDEKMIAAFKKTMALSVRTPPLEFNLFDSSKKIDHPTLDMGTLWDTYIEILISKKLVPQAEAAIQKRHLAAQKEKLSPFTEHNRYRPYFHQALLAAYTGEDNAKPENKNRIKTLFNQAIQAHPFNERIYHTYAHFMKSSEEKIAVYQQMLAKRNSSAHYYLALLHDKIGETDKAIASYREALSYDWTARSNLSTHLLRKNQATEAEPLLDEALLIHDFQNNSDVDVFSDADKNLQAIFYTNRAAVRTHQGRFAQAIQDHETAIRLAPDTTFHRYALGVTLIKQGRYADGIRKLPREAGLSTRAYMSGTEWIAEAQQSNAYAILAWLKSNRTIPLQDLPINEEQLESLIEADNHHNSGVLWKAQKDWDRAAAYFRLAAARDEKQPHSLYALADVLRETGKQQEAEQTRAEAAKRAEGYIDTYRHLESGLLITKTHEFPTWTLDTAAYEVFQKHTVQDYAADMLGRRIMRQATREKTFAQRLIGWILFWRTDDAPLFRPITTAA